MVNRVVIIVFCLIFPLIALSQEELSTSDKRAVKVFEKARRQFYQHHFREALNSAQKAIDKDPKFTEAYLLAAESCIESNQPKNAIGYLEQMLAFAPKKYPPAWKLLANLQFSMHYYDDAISSLKAYPNVENDKESLEMLSIAKFRLSQLQNPLDIQLINAGMAINTNGCEYVNAISLDGKKIYFTRKPADVAPGSPEKWDEDFYFSEQKDSVWLTAKSLGEQINTRYNEGAMHLSADNRFLFFTSCRGKEGYGSCDLYFSKRINDTTWEEPFNLGPVINSPKWETQPCFSSDGRTLFFISTRGGGQGGADIWTSRLKTDGTWTTPENAGPVLNTKGEEMAPYLHPDGNTLYFSSDGHKGMGGQDLFMTTLQPDSSWSVPQNMGYPINNADDQINMIVNAAGNTAYLSSVDSSGYGCYDIYSFELPAVKRPNEVAYLQGKVYDSISGKPLKAHFELTDLAIERVVVSSSSGEDGRFIIALPSGKNYALHVEREGYLFYSEHFPFHQEAAKKTKKDIPLQPIKENALLNLNNIFFAFDSDSLRPSSKAELNKLIAFLKHHPSIRVRIEGHTDSKGSEKYNALLSRKRARAVVKYLARNGVSSLRLSSKGYGESKPIGDNGTETGRARNRRTEVRILKTDF